MSVDTVIRNCKIVRHDGIFQAGLALHKGKIAAIADDDLLPPARETINAQGRFVLPGIVDAHVHLEYPPGVEPVRNIQMETTACAAAGCTTIVHLLAPADDILAKAKEFTALYEQHALVDLALSARIYTLDNIKQIPKLADFGINNVKLLLPYKGTEAVWQGRVGGIDDGIIYATFQQVGRLAQEGRPVFVRVHCENVEIFLKNKAMFLEEQHEPASWNEVRPRVCELEAMHKCLYFAELTGCPIYIVHMTVKEGVGLVQKARAQDIRVCVETCVQYLTLNTETVDPVLSKVMPPIRTARDNEELWKALRAGQIDVVATDHAPVPSRLKTDFWEATPGIPGAELFLPLMLSEGVNKGEISLEKLVEVCSYNPARQFGVNPRKGVIATGSDADLVFVDLDKEAFVPESPVYSKRVRLSP